ncbi:MAG: putative lipid II flippase FtsW [Firmicutes bacterium]|nr:putative lipid II flippase FtsW [Bacillota bacterium]
MLKFNEENVKRQKTSKQKRDKVVRQSRVLNYEKLIINCSRLKPKYLNLGLLIPILAISIFGVLMVYSASWYNATIYFNNPFYFFTSQLIGFIIGILMLTLTYFLDYKVYRRFSWVIIGIATFLLLLVFVPGLGITRLGASRWIGIGGFTMQPSELAKFAFIIFAAKVASETFKTKEKSMPEQVKSKKRFGLKPKGTSSADGVSRHLSIKQLGLILLIGGGFCGLILLQPNLSIVMTLGATMFVCLFLFGAKLKHLGILLLPVLVIVPIMLVAEPYRISRLVAFVDPWATPRAEGFQLIQSLFSLGNGGLFGRGFLNSTQKYMFLPFSESDFIFSIIGEEFGLVGAMLFLATLGYIIWRIFKVGRESTDTFGKYLCFGIAVLIFIQSVLNIAVVTGSIPPTGLPLPFISFGGTSLAVFMAAIGIVLNIDKQNKKMTSSIN